MSVTKTKQRRIIHMQIAPVQLKNLFSMKRIFFILLPLIVLAISMKSDKPAYQFFDADGDEMKYKKVIEMLEEADIVLFGELHNNPVSHWMQLEITKDLFELKGGKIAMGAEMFEADNQLMIDEYFEGFYDAKKFEAEARLWPNYKTDYKPLLEFAKEKKIKFVATNIPRRYASVVHKKGFEGLDSLPDESKRYFPPLPIDYDPELPGYKQMLEDMKSMGHANENLPKAQAVKDATMAWSILKNHENGKVFIHYHGTYHSNNFEGIGWYLKKKNPDLKIVTIAGVEQPDLDSLKAENKNLANIILAIDEDMTKTH